MSPAVVTLAPARGPESAASARHAACRSRPPSTDTLRRTRTLDDPVEEGATEVNITRLISETRRLFAPLAAARPRSPAGDRRRHHEFMRCFRSCLRPKDLFRGPVLVPYRAAAAARPALPETPRERPQGRAGGVGTSETVGARAYGPISASCAVYRTKRQRRAASVAAAGLKSLAAHGGSTAGVASLVKSAPHGESTAGLTSPVKSVARGSSTAGQTSPVKSVARGNSTAGVRPARPQTSRQGPGTESTGNVLEEDAGLNCGVSQRGAPRPALCQQREAGSRAGISVTTVTDAETSAGPRPRLDHRNSAVIILKPEVGPCGELSNLINIMKRPSFERSSKEQHYVYQALRSLKPFTQLSPFFLKDLCKMAALLEFPEGKVVFRQGDVGEHCFSVLVIFPVLSSSAERACVLTTAVKRFRPRRLATRDVKLNRPGTSWYVLLSGLVDVFICPEPNNTGTMNKIAQLKAGDGFGELALVNDKPRSATIVTAERCFLLRVDREDYMRTARFAHEREREEKINFLKQLPLFEGWSISALKGPADFFKFQTYSQGEFIAVEGQPCPDVQFVKSGVCAVYRSLKRETREGPKADPALDAGRCARVARTGAAGPPAPSRRAERRPPATPAPAPSTPRGPGAGAAASSDRRFPEGVILVKLAEIHPGECIAQEGVVRNGRVVPADLTVRTLTEVVVAKLDRYEAVTKFQSKFALLPFHNWDQERVHVEWKKQKVARMWTRVREREIRQFVVERGRRQ